jgi:hypothetical protein
MPQGRATELPACQQGSSPGSTSRLIPALKEGDNSAAQALGERYFQPPARIAGSRVGRSYCLRCMAARAPKDR